MRQASARVAQLAGRAGRLGLGDALGSGTACGGFQALSARQAAAARAFGDLQPTNSYPYAKDYPKRPFEYPTVGREYQQTEFDSVFDIVRRHGEQHNPEQWAAVMAKADAVEAAKLDADLQEFPEGARPYVKQLLAPEMPSAARLEEMFAQWPTHDEVVFLSWWSGLTMGEKRALLGRGADIARFDAKFQELCANADLLPEERWDLRREMALACDEQLDDVLSGMPADVAEGLAEQLKEVEVRRQIANEFRHKRSLVGPKGPVPYITPWGVMHARKWNYADVDFGQATGRWRWELEMTKLGINMYCDPAYLEAQFGLVGWSPRNPVIVNTPNEERVIGVVDPDDDHTIWWSPIRAGDAPRQIIEDGPWFVCRRIDKEGTFAKLAAYYEILMEEELDETSERPLDQMLCQMKQQLDQFQFVLHDIGPDPATLSMLREKKAEYAKLAEQEAAKALAATKQYVGSLQAGTPAAAAAEAAAGKPLSALSALSDADLAASKGLVALAMQDAWERKQVTKWVARMSAGAQDARDAEAWTGMPLAQLKALPEAELVAKVREASTGRLAEQYRAELDAELLTAGGAGAEADARVQQLKAYRAMGDAELVAAVAQNMARGRPEGLQRGMWRSMLAGSLVGEGVMRDGDSLVRALGLDDETSRAEIEAKFAQ